MVEFASLERCKMNESLMVADTFNLRHSLVPGRPRCSVSAVEACADGVVEVFSLTLCVCTSWNISSVFCVKLRSIQRGEKI